MPEELKLFLQNLTTKQADEVWLWLDNQPYAVSEMIEVVVDSHQDLTAK